MNNSQNNCLIPGCTHEAEPGRMHGAEHQPELPLYKNAPKAGTPEASTISSSEPVLPVTGWAVKLQHFPAELRDKPIWCVWRYLVREAKPTKVPMQIDGRMAKSNDPQTWATFTDACVAADADGELGVGVFCDGSSRSLTSITAAMPKPVQSNHGPHGFSTALSPSAN